MKCADDEAASRQRGNSKSTAKCGHCKKVVRDDDFGAKGCHSCVTWFHDSCAGLSVDEVRWLYTRKNCLWVCDNCLDEDSLPTKTEARLTSPLHSFSEKVKTSLSEIVPKALKDSLPPVLQDNVKKAVSDSLPSFRDVATSKPAASGNNCEVQFVITGAPETEPSYLKQLEKDSDQVNEIVNHLGLSPDNNITSIRRLGKKENPTNNLKRNCRPLLVTTSNALFMQK